MIKVMIDPGHAPGNPNKGPTGYYEYEGVWKISIYLQEILQAKGMQADFTRAWEQDPELYARGQKAKGYDLFISEHTNAYDGKTRGVEVFYDYSKPQDKEFADKLAEAVASVMNNSNRGAKTRVYTENGKIYNYYGVIRGAAATDCKHILLIESGFHDNVDDEAFLKADENLRKIAEVQAAVICEFLGVKGMTIDEALRILKENGIISNVEPWKTTIETGKYFEVLCKNMAEKLRDNKLSNDAAKQLFN